MIDCEQNDSLAQLHHEMHACRRCLDAGHQIEPGAVFRGGSGAQVLLIGQAPGVTEVVAKRPFNASSGRRLFQWLGEAGWDEADFRERHYMTAVTKCFPGKGKNGKGDRVPSRAEQQICRPFLDRELTLVNPRLIILVGGLAIKLLYPKKWRLNEIVGTAVYFPDETPLRFDFTTGTLVANLQSPISNPQSPTPLKGNGRWVIPLPHPSGASLWPNKLENKALIKQAIQTLHTIREAYEL